MAYSNWDTKPRIHKSYQAGNSLIIEGAHLDRWATNIGTIELFFEYYSYYSTGTLGYGYMIGATPNENLIPTREVVQTITSPTVSVNTTATVMTINIGFDISNHTKTFTDTVGFFGGGTKHALLHAKLTWSGLNSVIDGATSYSVLFNCWREIDVPHSWDTHDIRRNSRNTLARRLIEYEDVTYIKYKSPIVHHYKAIICDTISNSGVSTRQGINGLTSLGGQPTQIGYGCSANLNFTTSAISQSRYYVGVAQLSGTEFVMSLNASVPTYILVEDGVESQLSLPLPDVTDMYYDRPNNKYVVIGTGLTNRPIYYFGYSQRNNSTASEVWPSSFSNPDIILQTPTRLEIAMGQYDLHNGSYSTIKIPLTNRLVTMYLGFLDQSPDINSTIFAYNFLDGVLPTTTFNTYVDSDPTSPNFGKIDASAMNNLSVTYDPSTWGDGSAHKFTVWIKPTYNGLQPNSMRIASLENGSAAYLQYPYTWESCYSEVVIGGQTFGKLDINMRLQLFPIDNRIGRFVIDIDRIYGDLIVNVEPVVVPREITFDVPYVVLGDVGYYDVGESVLRGDRAVLFARAIDTIGVSEHPPLSPYNNTVRISDAVNGWGNVRVDVIGDDGIDIQPFTTSFLSGGQNGEDYSYEVSRFEISLKPNVNIWSGQLHIHIPTPFVLNFIEYSGSGISVPITLTRQNTFVIPLETSDPRSCIRGQIDGNQGIRKIDFKRYVPDYLKDSPFENFVGVFEDQLNTLYTGATPSDPYALNHGILDKIDGLLDLHDPDTIPSNYLHILAKNLGYDMVSGILRARDIANAPDDLVRYARFLVANLPEINRIKTTKDSIRGLMFSVGALADIYYKWTSNYGTNLDSNFIQQPSLEREWSESNENRLYEQGTNIETQQITDINMGLTPHFSIDVDLLRFDLYAQADSIVDILGRLLNTINAIRPINTVLDDLSLVITVEHDAKQLPSFIEGWGVEPPPPSPYRLFLINTNFLRMTQDGETWTSLGALGDTRHIMRVGKRYCVSLVNTSGVLWSDDLVSWTPATVVAGSGMQMAAMCSDGEFFYCGIYGGANGGIYKSEDAITWSKISGHGSGSTIITNLTYSNGMFCSIGAYDGNGTGAIYTSPDAVNWQYVNGFSSSWPTITYHANDIIMVRFSGQVVISRNNGVSWVSLSNSNGRGLALPNGEVAVISGSNMYIYDINNTYIRTVVDTRFELGSPWITYGDGYVYFAGGLGSSQVVVRTNDFITFTTIYNTGSSLNGTPYYI